MSAEDGKLTRQAIQPWTKNAGSAAIKCARIVLAAASENSDDDGAASLEKAANDICERFGISFEGLR